jgi:hypothetical protein
MQVNDIQGSPFQADLTYRGYRASGLLGASQGLSVYLDGVRINEPFGDVINWDMVPEFALQSLTVLPGANPSFGLNTLGGAIVLETVDGRSAEGLRAEAGFGSHGRKRAEVGLGQRHANGWHSYVGGTVFDENGWRDHSPGKQALVLARIGRSAGGTDWSVGVLRRQRHPGGQRPAAQRDAGRRRRHARPVCRIAQRRVHPPRPHQEPPGPGHVQLQPAAGRRQPPAGPGLCPQQPARHRQRRRRRRLRPAAARRERVAEHHRHAPVGLGCGAEPGPAQWRAPVAGGRQCGLSRVRYRQLEQEGSFDATRGVLAGDEDAELSASVTGKSLHLGLYATDTWQLAPGTHVTATLRANRSRVSNTLTTVDDDTGVLEAKPKESFTYTSLNPALGLTQQVGTGGLAGGLAVCQPGPQHPRAHRHRTGLRRPRRTLPPARRPAATPT